MQTLDFGSAAMTLADRVAADLPGFAAWSRPSRFSLSFPGPQSRPAVCHARTFLRGCWSGFAGATSTASATISGASARPIPASELPRKNSASATAPWRPRSGSAAGDLPAWQSPMMPARSSSRAGPARRARRILRFHHDRRGRRFPGGGGLSPRLHAGRRRATGRASKRLRSPHGQRDELLVHLAAALRRFAPSDRPTQRPRRHPACSRLLLPLPLGVRAHAADVLRHLVADPSTPRTLASLSRYETRKRGLDVTESTRLIMDSGLVVPATELNGWLSGWTRRDLLGFLAHCGVRPRNSWSKERLAEVAESECARPAAARMSESGVVELNPSHIRGAAASAAVSRRREGDLAGLARLRDRRQLLDHPASPQPSDLIEPLLVRREHLLG